MKKFIIVQTAGGDLIDVRSGLEDRVNEYIERGYTIAGNLIHNTLVSPTSGRATYILMLPMMRTGLERIDR